VLRSHSSHAVGLGLKRRPTFIQEVGVTDYNADANEKISSSRSSFSFARRRCEERNTQPVREYSETLIVAASGRERERGRVEKRGEV
jgi:hypothetical protein